MLTPRQQQANDLREADFSYREIAVRLGVSPTRAYQLVHKNPHARTLMKKYNKTRRVRAIEKLGGICCVCGESDVAVLEIDHISPVLTGRREPLHLLHARILRGDTQNLQLLCANDHRRKTRKDGSWAKRL